jgi:hypothetical protein
VELTAKEMAEVGLQLMHDPFWLRIGSLDETRRIFSRRDTVTAYFRDKEQVAQLRNDL